MPTLSLIDLANRHHLAPKTLKGWHAAELVPALQAGSPGKPWVFDQAATDHAIAQLPRCAYSGCDRAVAEQGAACRLHRLAIETEGKPRPRDIVDKVAASLRSYEDPAGQLGVATVTLANPQL